MRHQKDGCKLLGSYEVKGSVQSLQPIIQLELKDLSEVHIVTSGNIVVLTVNEKAWLRLGMNFVVSGADKRGGFLHNNQVCFVTGMPAL